MKVSPPLAKIKIKSNKLHRVPPSIDDIKIVQVKNSFNKDDEDHISTVLHSQYEGYFSRNSDYTKSEDITAIHDTSLNNKEELEEE